MGTFAFWLVKYYTIEILIGQVMNNYHDFEFDFVNVLIFLIFQTLSNSLKYFVNINNRGIVGSKNIKNGKGIILYLRDKLFIMKSVSVDLQFEINLWGQSNKCYKHNIIFTFTCNCMTTSKHQNKSTNPLWWPLWTVPTGHVYYKHNRANNNRLVFYQTEFLYRISEF